MGKVALKKPRNICSIGAERSLRSLGSHCRCDEPPTVRKAERRETLIRGGLHERLKPHIWVKPHRTWCHEMHSHLGIAQRWNGRLSGAFCQVSGTFEPMTILRFDQFSDCFGATKSGSNRDGGWPESRYHVVKHCCAFLGFMVFFTSSGIYGSIVICAKLLHTKDGSTTSKTKASCHSSAKQPGRVHSISASSITKGIYIVYKCGINAFLDVK